MEIAINGFREQIGQLRELADWSAFPANKIKFHCSIDIVYAAQPLLEFWNCSGRKIAIYRSGGKQYSETVFFLSDCINLFEEQVSPRLVISALKEQGKSRQWWTNKILTP